MRPGRSAASLFVLALTTTLMVFVGQAPAHAHEAETRVLIQLEATKARVDSFLDIDAAAQAHTPEAGAWQIPQPGSLTLQRRAAGTKAWKTSQTYDGTRTTFAFRGASN